MQLSKRRGQLAVYLAAISVTGLLARAEPASAQFPQYINPGSLGLPAVGTREAIEKAVGNAPYKVGPVRLQPYIGLRDIGYVDNIFPSGRRVSAFTISAGAGLKVYVPFGPKVTLAAHVLPQYDWWYTREDGGPDEEIEKLSGWRYRSGAGLFAYFNRLTAELHFNDSDLLSYISHEFDSPGDIEKRSWTLNLGSDIAGPFGVFGAVDYSEWKYDDNDFSFAFPDQLEILDRDETVVRLGVRYEREDGLSFGLGYQMSEVDFSRDRRDRSNEGEGPLLTVSYIGARFSTGVNVVQNEITAVEGSQFTEYKELTGDARLTLRTTGRLGVSLYGSRQVVYTLTPGTSYYSDERIGAHLEVRAGWRTNLRIYLEDGIDEYETLGPTVTARVDEFIAYGAELQFKLRETSNIILGLTTTEFDSNIPGFDREITNLRFAVNLGGALGW